MAPTITSNGGGNNEVAAFYSFDETSGSIAQDQQGEHDGTIIGATHVPGVSGNALQFNGSSDYVSVPDSSEWNLGSDDFTIEFWVNFNSIPGGGLNGDVPIAQDEGGGTQNKWLINFNGSSIDFHVVNPSIGGSFSISAPFQPTIGQWYAFALTKSGSSYQFYVDGRLVGSADETLAIPDVAAPLTIGQAEDAFYFDGKIDGVAIHHRALSQAEVQQGYQDGASAPGAISISENTTAVTTVVATDPDAGQTLSYSITGGADATKFSINAATGALAFLTAPNFEAPTDAGANNVYDVTVQASDGNGGTDTQAIAVTVQNANEAPTITSNGGSNNEVAAFYSFDETSGSIARDQQGEHDGTIIGTTHVPGVTGNALQFDGSNPGYVSVPNSSDWNFGSSDFSIQVWANFSSIPSGSAGQLGDVLVAHDEGGGSTNKWVLDAYSGHLGFHVNNTAGQAYFAEVPFNPTPGQWYLIDLTETGSTYQFYVNGDLIGTAPAVPIPDASTPLTIGYTNDGLGITFGGSLDGVGIYHSALSQAEIQQGYQHGAAAPGAISISENTTAVTTVAATDPDAGQTLNYSIIGGADATKFTINATTGALAFLTAPNFEAPTDVGGNNVYDVTVQAFDGNGGIDAQAIAVTVQNVPGAIITGTDKAETLPPGTDEEDFIRGFGGNDTLQGLAGNDTLDGGSGKDTMTGGAGNDTYLVDNIGDVLIENTGGGTDTVLSSINFTLGANFEWLTLSPGAPGNIDGTGNALDNNITGNSGKNMLSGLAGSDLLDGRAGNDTLVGGLGADTLTGGAGADNFAFSASADSAPAQFDILQDFVHGTDKIDIAAIDANASQNGNQAFSFAGQNSSVVANSVTWYQSGGNTFVQADVNGNTAADFLIQLTGTNLNLSASDFLL
ncbi:LamG-like jellyroll fold domain-containing protein [Bradyrhizobium cosmicum]|uniref:LamG-like jellyroll fold domain-containing protein n=1 Tax=Bradyrhizobium cosmicum TaxID=1404864 RepID=UPI0028E325F4|nr:LamG-like jellyroll fold domain-containing protein [Bradyrhizobium cosmicum]